MKKLSNLQNNIYKAIKQNTNVKYTFTQALRPFSNIKITDHDPSSKDYVISLPILEDNHLSPIVMCVQKHSSKPYKLTNSWFINKYQKGSLIVKKLAKKNDIHINYVNLPHSSRLGIILSTNCNYSDLKNIIFRYTLAIIEISNYLQVNSYLDSPNTLKIQKLNS